jgi:hypothetical protein
LCRCQGHQFPHPVCPGPLAFRPPDLDGGRPPRRDS